MNEKIIELISLEKEIWAYIRSERKKFDNLSLSQVPNITIKKVRYQGSVATKTIINPKISKGKNDLDFDIAIVVKQLTNASLEESIINLRKLLKQKYPNNLVGEEKAIKIVFSEKKINNEIIKLSFDFVVLFETNNKNHELKVWNYKEKNLEYSNPFPLIDKFNERKGDEREIVKLLKALRDSLGIKGIKSIILLNSVLNYKNYVTWNDWLGLLEHIKKEFFKLKQNNFLISAADSKDKLFASSDFNYGDSISFIKEISSLDEEDIEKRINAAINNQYSKINNSIRNKQTIKKNFTKVHPWDGK